MALVRKVICDSCGKDAQLAIAGNIHTVDNTDPEGMGGGLIGMNFEFNEGTFNNEDTFIGSKLTRIQHYCMPCFIEIVGYSTSTTRKSPFTEKSDFE